MTKENKNTSINMLYSSATRPIWSNVKFKWIQRAEILDKSTDKSVILSNRYIRISKKLEGKNIVHYFQHFY